jgi:signal peptide peptidase SppA
MTSMIHVLTELWCKPSLILPQMHKQLCAIVHDHMTGAAHLEGGRALDFEAPETVKNSMSVIDGVAIIPIQGVLDKHANAMAQQSGATGLSDIEGMLAEAMLDDTVDGILLDVNSPGGSVTGIPELAKKIAAAATVKPVVAFTDTMAASAAYWLIAGSSAIVASESANIGSIGVYMAFHDTSRAMEMAGVKTILIKAGKFKAAGMDGIEPTGEQIDLMQAQVDQIAGWFNGFVAKFRTGMPESAREGQTFFGIDAVAIDMIDRVGSADDAMAELRSMIEERG